MRKVYTCYCCDELETSREHAPPQGIFPDKKYLPGGSKNYRENLITVPSCEKHNNKKSKDDEYLIALFTLTIPEASISNPMMKKWMKALERDCKLARRILSNSRKIRMLNEVNSLYVVQETLAITSEVERINNVVEFTARALYYYNSNFQKKWLKDITIASPNLLNKNLFIDRKIYNLYLTFLKHFDNPNIKKKETIRKFFIIK
jgi:hypothetical protein